jgi:hypothetical protein
MTKFCNQSFRPQAPLQGFHISGPSICPITANKESSRGEEGQRKEINTAGHAAGKGKQKPQPIFGVQIGTFGLHKGRTRAGLRGMHNY